MSHQFVGFENLSRNLLMHRRYGADKVVRYCDLFVLDEKDALVGFRPEAIQAFDVILSAQRRIVSGGLEDIEGMHTHHIGGKNLLITPRDFQITMSAVRLQHEPMLGLVVVSSKRSIATFSFVTSNFGILVLLYTRCARREPPAREVSPISQGADLEREWWEHIA